MKRAYEIIGAPFGFAANKSGSRTAPDYLRKNRLNIKVRQRTNEFWGSDIEDFGNVEVYSPINELYKSEKTLEAVKLYCEKLNDCVYDSYVRGKTPIIVGGDHSIQIIDYVSQSKKFMGADIVEYSPEDDTNGNTNQLVIKLIDTLVGYRM